MGTDQIMVVHAATTPNAVLRTLPALPHRLWAPSLAAAWQASAAVTAAYAAPAALPADQLPSLAAAGSMTTEEVFEQAAAHGDEHAIKLTDTVLDVVAAADHGDDLALAAALHACALIDPVL